MSSENVIYHTCKEKKAISETTHRKLALHCTLSEWTIEQQKKPTFYKRVVVASDKECCRARPIDSARRIWEISVREEAILNRAVLGIWDLDERGLFGRARQRSLVWAFYASHRVLVYADVAAAAVEMGSRTRGSLSLRRRCVVDGDL